MKSKFRFRFTSLLSLAFVAFIAIGAMSGCKMSPEKRAEKITCAAVYHKYPAAGGFPSPRLSGKAYDESCSGVV